eukprot:4398685-Amphidinium_carterae.1
MELHWRHAKPTHFAFTFVLKASRHSCHQTWNSSGCDLAEGVESDPSPHCSIGPFVPINTDDQPIRSIRLAITTTKRVCTLPILSGVTSNKPWWLSCSNTVPQFLATFLVREAL